MESPDGTKTQGVAAGLRLHLKYQFKTKKKKTQEEIIQNFLNGSV